MAGYVQIKDLPLVDTVMSTDQFVLQRVDGLLYKVLGSTLMGSIIPPPPPTPTIPAILVGTDAGIYGLDTSSNLWSLSGLSSSYIHCLTGDRKSTRLNS